MKRTEETNVLTSPKLECSEDIYRAGGLQIKLESQLNVEKPTNTHFSLPRIRRVFFLVFPIKGSFNIIFPMESLL